jgi:hypothetical protein
MLYQTWFFNYLEAELKKEVIIYFKVPSQYLPGQTEKNHKISPKITNIMAIFQTVYL